MRKFSRAKTMMLSVLSLTLLVVISSQACQQTHLFSNHSSSTNAAQSGNGSGYDYKPGLRTQLIGNYDPTLRSIEPSSVYLREIEDFSCITSDGSNRIGHAGRVSYLERELIYEKDACTAPLSAGVLEFTPFNPNYIIRGNQVFKRPSEDTTHKVYTSALCRTSSDLDVGSDVIIEKKVFDNNTIGSDTYIARLFTGQKTGDGIFERREVKGFDVIRKDQGNKTVFTSNAFDFQFEIDSSIPTGNFKGTVDDRKLELSLRCFNELKIGIAMASPAVSIGKAGGSLDIAFNWNGRPTETPLRVFVHVIDSSGVQRFQADHQPPAPTSTWIGQLSYLHRIDLPSSLEPGEYKIWAGLFDDHSPLPVGPRTALEPMNGAFPEPGGGLRYQIGTIRIEP